MNADDVSDRLSLDQTALSAEHDRAATMLLLQHRTWIWHDRFREHAIAVDPDADRLYIDWSEARRGMESGLFIADSPADAAALEFAVSLGEGRLDLAVLETDTWDLAREAFLNPRQVDAADTPLPRACPPR